MATAPAFIDHRIKIFEKLKAEHDEFVKSKGYFSEDDQNAFLRCIFFAAAQLREDIAITMPDGSERKGKSWETSPMDVAKEISKSLSERIVIAKVSFSSTRYHSTT
jgi:threonyl-tRNA synthetase